MDLADAPNRPAIDVPFRGSFQSAGRSGAPLLLREDVGVSSGGNAGAISRDPKQAGAVLVREINGAIVDSMPAGNPLKSRQDTIPALAKRPQAISLSIEHLLDQIDVGRIRVPDFQRPLRWDAEDIRLLFDSIQRGYPVGTLLFWQRPAEAGTIVLGSCTLQVPERHDALWVVDGQQRITALASVLNGPYDTPISNPFTLFFDLTKQEFVRPTSRRPVEPNWLPLNVVADSEQLLLWLHENIKDKDALGAAIRLGKRIREYQIPAYVIEAEDDGPLRDIYDRVNSTGRALKSSEVFDALHGRKGQKPSGTQAIATELDLVTGFGHIDEDIVLKALLAICDLDLLRDFRKQVGEGSDQIGQDKLTAGLPRARMGLQSAIRFLQNSAGIPHVSLMPYKLVLAVLTRFFDRYPDASPRSHVLLSRWLWRGALTSRHSGNAVLTRQVVGAVNNDEHTAVQKLLDLEQHKEPDEPMGYDPFNFRYARCKIAAIALWTLEPCDIATGQPLSISQLTAGDTPTQRIIPRPPTDAREQAGRLANIILYPAANKLRQRIIQQQDDKILAHHGITKMAHTALWKGDIAEFLRLRSEHLASYVAGFIHTKAQWGACDRPPIAALVVED